MKLKQYLFLLLYSILFMLIFVVYWNIGGNTWITGAVTILVEFAISDIVNMYIRLKKKGSK